MNGVKSTYIYLFSRCDDLMERNRNLDEFNTELQNKIHSITD